MSIKNPFEQTPNNLNNDDAEFLKKHGGASDAELDELGSKDNKVAEGNIIESPDSLEMQDFATPEEREEYLQGLVRVGKYEIIRKDVMCLQNLFNKINAQIEEPFSNLEDMLDAEDFEYNQRFVVISGRIFKINLSELRINTVDDFDFPDSLKILDLSFTAIAHLKHVPASLIDLSLRGTDITTLENIVFPATTQVLDVGKLDFSSSLENIQLPLSLKEINLSYSSIRSLDNVQLPRGLEELNLIGTKISSLHGVDIPKTTFIYISGTPLAKNPKRLARLIKKHPEENIILHA